MTNGVGQDRPLNVLRRNAIARIADFLLGYPTAKEAIRSTRSAD
jgi:hypothetical protein